MFNVVQPNQFPMSIYSYLQQLQLLTSAKYKKPQTSAFIGQA